MASYEIRDATIADMRQMAGCLRPKDRIEVTATGAAARHVLFGLWRDSQIRKVAFVDGEIAAVWGCGGVLASGEGEVWLLTAPPIEKLPIAFLKEAQRSVKEMLETKQTLVSGVLASYEESIRFMKLVGFSVGTRYMQGSEPFFELRMGR